MPTELMEKYLNKATATASVVAVAMLLSLGSCKGRTMDNMEPTGETIEVVIGQEDSDETAADSVGEANAPDGESMTE